MPTFSKAEPRNLFSRFKNLNLGKKGHFSLYARGKPDCDINFQSLLVLNPRKDKVHISSRILDKLLMSTSRWISRWWNSQSVTCDMWHIVTHCDMWHIVITLSKLSCAVKMRTYYCYSCLKVIYSVSVFCSFARLSFVFVCWHARNPLSWEINFPLPGIRPCCQPPCPLPWPPCHRWFAILLLFESSIVVLYNKAPRNKHLCLPFVHMFTVLIFITNTIYQRELR